MTTRTADGDAFLIGFATGLRSATPIAVIGRAARAGKLKLPPPLSTVGRPPVATVLSLAGIGELFADKLPFTPSRLDRRSLVVRAGAGALCGALIASANDAPLWRGMVAGKLGALAGSFAGYQARVRLTTAAVSEAERRGVSPEIARVAVAAAEDAVSITMGAWLVDRSSRV